MDTGRNRKIGWEVITTVLAEVIDDGLDEVKISRAASHLIYLEGHTDGICRQICLGV